MFKIRYDAALPALPSNLSGDTFVALLGTQTSRIENLLVKRKIMGPSWLALRGAQRVDAGDQLSWCKLEVRLAGKKCVCHPANQGREAPSLVVAALNVKTYQDPKKKTTEIASASVIYLHGVRTDSLLTKLRWREGWLV